MGSQGRDGVLQGNGPGMGGGAWRSGWYHTHMWISQEEQLGSETDHTT